MADPIETIEAKALALTPEERVRLADRVIASVFEDEDIEEAWSAEVEKRIDDIEAGRTSLILAGQSIARARNAIE